MNKSFNKSSRFAYIHNLPTYNRRMNFKDIRVEVSWCSCSTLNCIEHFM